MFVSAYPQQHSHVKEHMNRLVIPAMLIGFGAALAAPHLATADTATCRFEHWWSIACTATRDPVVGPVGCEPVPGAPVHPTAGPTNTITVLPLPPD